MALLVSMVVSLTVIPVLAARFLARRRMPTTGPIYRRLAGGYERCSRVGLRFPRTDGALALLAVLPGWWLFTHLESGFMPEMDEGAFILDYWMPVGHLAGRRPTRCSAASRTGLLDTPDMAGYHPPHRRGEWPVRHRIVPRRYPREPQAGRPAPADGGRLSTPCASDSSARCPRCEYRVRAAGPGPDQRPQRRARSGGSQGLRTRPGQAAAVGRRGGRDRWRRPGREDVNAHVYLGNPDIVVRPDSVQTARVGLTEQDVENQLRRGALRPGGQHAAASRTASPTSASAIPDAVRFDRATAGRSCRSACPAAAAATPGGGRGFVPLGQLASMESRPQPNELWRENQQPVITVTGELGEPRPGQRQPRSGKRGWPSVKLPARLSLGAGRQLPRAAGVVRQPADGADRRPRHWCFCCWASSSAA